MQFEQDDMQQGRQVCWLPLERIVPRPSVEREQDGMPLAELAQSIARYGLIQPITVRRTNAGRYMIVSGNRRYMASRMAGLSHVDAVVLDGLAVEQAARDLLEAILSGKLHYLDAAEGMKRLMERHGFSRDDLARSLGCTAAAVAQSIRLTELDGEIKALLMEQGLGEGYARALLKLPDRRARMSIALQAVRERLCIRDVELLVASAQARLPVPPLPGGRTITLVRDHRLYLNAIRSIVAQMQEAGMAATAEENTLGDCVEVVLRMPTRRRRATIR